MGTTDKGAPYPDGSDAPDGPGQIHDLADWVDERPGVGAYTYAQINALAGADLWEGRTVWQTNEGTDRPYEGLYQYDGVEWRLPWSMPWGELPGGYVDSDTLNQAVTSATAVNVTGMTVTLDVVENRKLEVRAFVLVEQSGSAGLSKVYLTDGTNNVLGTIISAHLADSGPGSRSLAEVGVPLRGLSGSQTFKLRALTSAGTCTLKGTANGDPGPCWISVRDLGPDGAPT